MKLRMFLVTVLASLMLVSCSLAEDITPPPDTSSPTSTSTVLPATRTPESTPAQTAVIETLNPTLDSSTAQADTSGATPEISPTAQITTVNINGLVTVASGAVLPAGSIATLLLYDTTAGQVIESMTFPILPDGRYEFTDVPANNTTAYFVTVDYKGITYNSAPALFDGTNSLLEMPVVVYDSTEDMQTLTLAQVHLQFDFSTSGVVQVMELYVLVNSGETAVLIPTDGTNIPFIQLPEGALDVKYQLAQGSASLLSTANGFALLPGADKQYAIISTFTLPYVKRLDFSQPFNLPVTATAVIVPEGVKVRSEQLTDGGTKDSQGSTFHLYQADSLASGSTLTMVISGLPGSPAGFVLNQRTWIMIGVGVLGLILIGLGIFLFLRDRKLGKLEEQLDALEDSSSEEDAIGNDRESIMDAIIALDDQYKDGGLAKEAYEARRTELKDRLKRSI